MYIITSAEHLCWFIVCLSVSNITEKRENGFSWVFQDRSGMAQWNNLIYLFIDVVNFNKWEKHNYTAREVKNCEASTFVSFMYNISDSIFVWWCNTLFPCSYGYILNESMSFVCWYPSGLLHITYININAKSSLRMQTELDQRSDMCNWCRSAVIRFLTT